MKRGRYEIVNGLPNENITRFCVARHSSIHNPDNPTASSGVKYVFTSRSAVAYLLLLRLMVLIRKY